jgi:hypothetical protein
MIIKILVAPIMIISVFVVGVAQLCAAKSIQSYLHKKAILAVPPLSQPPLPDLIPKKKRMPISPLEACKHAIEHIEAKGIKNIVICEVQWIAAPVSGYLVDTKGKLTLDHQIKDFPGGPLFCLHSLCHSMTEILKCTLIN